jgi:excisionase family DNA binding protein
MPTLHNIKEVAAMFQVSTRTIAKLIKRGDLTPTRIGDRLLFHPDELDRFSREGVRSISAKPVDRNELDSYINTLGDGKLKHVLVAYTAALDGKPVSDAASVYQIGLRIGNELLAIIDAKKTTGEVQSDGERLAVKYVGHALQTFFQVQAA